MLGKAQAATCIAFTGQQGFFKALGFANGVAALQQAHQGAGIQALAAVDVAVLTRHNLGQLLAVAGYAPAFAYLQQQIHAALFMLDMARQDVGRRCAFAKVMAQAGKAHAERSAQPGRHVHYQHGVYAAVDLGVVLGALGHAPQVVELGQQHGQCAAFAQDFKHARWLLFHQPA